MSGGRLIHMLVLPDTTIHTRIEAERKAALPHAEQIKVFRAYAKGKQRGTLTAGQQRILRGLLGQKFADNICKRILAELRNRLRLARFEVPNAAVLAALESLFVLNQLGAFSAAVHWAMLRDGNTAVSLGWLGGRVRLSRERWWNGKTGMFVAYDDADRPAYAVKDWSASGGGMRRTIWYPDRIERYSQDAGGWRLINLPDDDVQQDGQPRAVPWVDREGKALGIPGVHFANIQVPNDAEGDDSTDEGDPRYGMSELDGGILGLQDEINDLHRDISAAARFAGYQTYWATGVQEPVDEDGKPVGWKVEPGMFYSDTNAQAAFGTMPAGSLSELQRALEIKLQAVGRSAAIPMHLISGEWPSGEALLRAEMPLIDKVETLGAAVGPAWASVAHKATQIANTFGNAGLDTNALITTVLLPVARRDPLTLAQIAAAEAPFVSQRQTLRTLGYAPAEIERILAERQREQVEAAPKPNTNGTGAAVPAALNGGANA